MGENTPHTLRRDIFHHTIGDQLSGQLGTIPLGQTAALQIGQLTSHLDQMQSHSRREGRLSSRSGLIQQPVHTVLLKPMAPFVDVSRGHTHFRRRADPTFSVRQQEDRTRPSRYPGGCGRPALQRQQCAENDRTQHDLPTASSSPPPGLARRLVYGRVTVLTAANQNIFNKSCFWHSLSCQSLGVLSSPILICCPRADLLCIASKRRAGIPDLFYVVLYSEYARTKICACRRGVRTHACR